MPDSWGAEAVSSELEHTAGLALVTEAPAASPGETGRLGGYVFFRRGPGEAELMRLGVDPALRGRGLGSALVRAGLAVLESEGCATCLLEVREDNAPARALYGRLGFTEVGRRRAYYPDGEDAILLTRRIAEA